MKEDGNEEEEKKSDSEERRGDREDWNKGKITKEVIERRDGRDPVNRKIISYEKESDER